MKLVTQADERFSRMPFLCKYDQVPALRDGRAGNLFDNKRRSRTVEIGQFAFFTIVDPQWVIPADPLAPAIQFKAAIQIALQTREDQDCR